MTGLHRRGNFRQSFYFYLFVPDTDSPGFEFTTPHITFALSKELTTLDALQKRCTLSRHKANLNAEDVVGRIGTCMAYAAIMRQTTE